MPLIYARIHSSFLTKIVLLFFNEVFAHFCEIRFAVIARGGLGLVCRAISAPVSIRPNCFQPRKWVHASFNSLLLFFVSPNIFDKIVFLFHQIFLTR